ncbi:MAG: ABC-type peptide/nickel transport system ATP-binding protein [Candidatus Phytoplasma cynodontis]|uniref:ABC transporter ATP-binding protein n=1 Tax='Cynodon dactylon' phytoplasma TaxID=295320 RepID=UPI001FCE61EE|nr:ABC transporter ATP-binding protein ['Cynodon dactylon' phytoplasma]WIA07687.1 MAG: ABC-type peptide/nickel transport system ATP-binding protein [Candidatus Phytoplasma cynodontis]
MTKEKVLIKIKNLNKFFKIDGINFQANKNISFSIFKGETLSIIGESGSGKSTLAKIIIQLQKADKGEIIYFKKNNFSQNLNELNKNEMNLLRKDIQIIFQNSITTLNPKFLIKDIIGEGLIIQKKVKNKKDSNYNKKIIEIMKLCGLDLELMNRFPYELSGGQRQRVNIAKTLILKPKLVICDEIVSALDVIIQKQILDLLNYFKYKYKITYLFISHDLGVARFISDRIGVMFKGHLVELAKKEEIFKNPLHFYTKKMLKASPKIIHNDIDLYNNAHDSKEIEREELNFNKNEDKYFFKEVRPNHFVLKYSEAKRKK